jgi:hypothetical protein
VLEEKREFLAALESVREWGFISVRLALNSPGRQNGLSRMPLSVKPASGNQ